MRPVNYVTRGFLTPPLALVESFTPPFYLEVFSFFPPTQTLLHLFSNLCFYRIFQVVQAFLVFANLPLGLTRNTYFFSIVFTSGRAPIANSVLCTRNHKHKVRKQTYLLTRLPFSHATSLFRRAEHTCKTIHCVGISCFVDIPEEEGI